MTLSEADLALHSAYKGEYETVKEYTTFLETRVRDILRDAPYEMQISSRAKTVDSLLAKLRRKGYVNPGDQISDLVGVRVIAYYQDDVDRVVDLLRTNLEVDDSRSIDKRDLLLEAEFGYRSVHIVSYLPEVEALGLGQPSTIHCFEVQVRSFLEHAWAETEHEIRYKSGIKFPTESKRRFAAIAGALDILEREFVGLRGEQDELVFQYRDAYAGGRDGAINLDAARLAGLLEHVAPEAAGWRSSADVTGREFLLRSAATCVEALAKVGLTTAGALLTAFETPRYKRLRDSYAAESGVGASEVSHLAMAVLGVAAVDSDTLDEFPELLADATLQRVASTVR